MSEGDRPRDDTPAVERDTDHTDADGETDTDRPPDTDVEIDTDPAADTDGVVDTPLDSDLPPATDSRPDTDTALDTDVGPDTDTATDTDSALDTDVGLDTDTGADTDIALDTDVGPDTDTALDTDMALDTDTLPPWPWEGDTDPPPPACVTRVGCDAWPTTFGRMPNAFTGTGVGAGATPAGDVTGDGVDDVLFPGRSTTRARVKAGGAPLSDVMVSADACTVTVSSASTFVADDLDADGVSDLIAFSIDTVRVWRGPLDVVEDETTADLSLTVAADEPGVRRGAVVGDLDGDGRARVGVIRSALQGATDVERAQVLKLDPAWWGTTRRLAEAVETTWTAPVDLSLTGLGWLRVGDVDGDGREDLAVTTSNSSDRIVLRPPWPDAGGPLADVPGLAPSWAWGGRIVGAADVDGDGLSELLALSSLTWLDTRAWIIPGDFLPDVEVDHQAIATLYGTGEDTPTSIAVKDVDVDGTPDIVLGLQMRSMAPCGPTFAMQAGASSYGLMLVRGPVFGEVELARLETWLTRPGISILLTSDTSRLVSLGDLDGDGRDDLIVDGIALTEVPTCPQLDPPARASCETRPLGEIYGGPLAEDPWSLDPWAFGGAGACAVDGPTCLVAGRTLVGLQLPGHTRDAVLWFDQSTHALIAAYEDLSCGRRWYGHALACEGGTHEDCAALGVCAALDPIAVTEPHPGPVCDVWPTGHVGLVPHDHALPDLERVPDLSGDGVPDVFLGGDLVEGGLTLDATQTAPPFASVAEPTRVVADVDGDGQADVVVLDASSLRIHLGPVSGALEPSMADASMPLGALPLDTLGTPGDLDGDGVEELVGWWDGLTTTGAVGRMMSVFTLDAALTGPVVSMSDLERARWEAGPSTHVVRGADLDGDGADDLILVSTQRSQVWRLPFPSTTWLDLAPSITLLTASQSFSGVQSPVTAGDLDGDGDDELVIGAKGSIFRSEPDVVYIVHSWTGTRRRPADVAAATWVGDAGVDLRTLFVPGDLDGDGGDDLLVVSAKAGLRRPCIHLGMPSELQSAQGGVLVVLDPLHPNGRPLSDAGGDALLPKFEQGYSEELLPAVDLTGVVTDASLVLGAGAWSVPSCP